MPVRRSGFYRRRTTRRVDKNLKRSRNASEMRCAGHSARLQKPDDVLRKPKVAAKKQNIGPSSVNCRRTTSKGLITRLAIFHWPSYPNPRVPIAELGPA